MSILLRGTETKALHFYFTTGTASLEPVKDVSGVSVIKMLFFWGHTLEREKHKVQHCPSEFVYTGVSTECFKYI